MSDRELLTECLEALTHDAAQRTFAGGVRMSQLAIKLRAHLAAPSEDIETLRRDAERLKADNERLRGLLTDASKAVWMNYDGDLLDRIEAALKEVPR